VSRRPAIVTQADIARAIRAAKQTRAGAVQVHPDGTITILLSPPPPGEQDTLEQTAEIVL